MSNEVLDELCREGKIITIQAEITNKEEALNLAGTLFRSSPNESVSGINVISWGAFDILAAHEVKDQLIILEIERHKERMDYLLDSNNLREILEGE